jgi:thiamine pyrophosphate-dependent acetolactate synthase large subunit-like protein
MPTGADLLVEALASGGVKTVFGLPGVHNLAVWEALRKAPLRLVGVRHEQTAVYAADGLARATGIVGAAIVTTGPGAANTLGATGEAYASHSPVIVIATDIPTALRRQGTLRGVLHETRDQAAMFVPVVKETFVVTHAENIGTAIARAAATALTAPCGPVYLQVPTDLLVATVAVPSAVASPTGPATPPARPPSAASLAHAAELLTRADRPLIWVGGGAVAAGEALARVAEQLRAPVVETYGGRGLLAPGHPSWIGLPPHVPSVGALWDAADVVLAVGTDFDGMSTQNWLQPQPPRMVAINIDADDATKNYAIDVLVESDARVGLEALVPLLPQRAPARVARLREAFLAELAREQPLAAQLLATLAKVLPSRAVVVCDMCIPGYWVGGFHSFPAPRRLAYPVGWGTLGFGFPASLGPALGQPDPVLAVCGDGGFLFACGELATAAQEQADLTVLLVDDGGYGMLRFDQRHAGAEPFGVDLTTPDFVGLAQAFGVRAVLVNDVGEPLEHELQAELATPGPGVVVLNAALEPPPTTSPLWYRKAHMRRGAHEIRN